MTTPLISALQALSSAGRELQAMGDGDESAAARQELLKGLAVDGPCLAGARQLASGSQPAFYEQLPQAGVSLPDVCRCAAAGGGCSLCGRTEGCRRRDRLLDQSSPPTAGPHHAPRNCRALKAAMGQGQSGQAVAAATLYTLLLSSPGCPVFSLFDRLACGAFLKLVRDASAGAKGKKGGGKGQRGAVAAPAADGDPFAPAPGDAMDVDSGSDGESAGGRATQGSQRPAGAAAGSLAEAVLRFATLLAGFGLRDQPDTARAVAEAFAEVTRAPGAAPELSEAAFGVLLALLAPAHGSVREVSAMVLRLLTGNLLADKATRARGLAFAKATLT